MIDDFEIIDRIISAFPGLQGYDADVVADAIATEGLFLSVFENAPEELVKYCTVEGQPVMLPRKPHTKMGIETLPGIAELFDDLIHLRHTKFVVLAPRGGGKSAVVGVAVAVTWTTKGWDWFVVGGSEVQAAKVHQYFKENVRRWKPLLPPGWLVKDTMTETRSVDFGQVGIGAASQKRVRSPHMGNKDKPGGLIIDEEMEADGDIINAAKFIVSTANPPVIVRTSTAHKAEGPFLDCVDGAPDNGYHLYAWDVFDIAQQCPYDCDECPVEDFAHDIYDHNELTGVDELVHLAYCAGKAKFSEGWVPIDSIVSLWNEVLREDFECEALGWRRENTTYLIQDRKGLVQAFERSLPQLDANGTKLFAIDWGYSGESAVGLFEADMNGYPVLTWLRFYSHATIDRIVADMNLLRETRNVNRVLADASHPFNNARLSATYRYHVRGIMFNQRKTLGVQRLNGHIRAGTITIPVQSVDQVTVRSFGHLLKQLRGWKRRNGKIVKADDHGPDMLICAMQEFPTADSVSADHTDDDDETTVYDEVSLSASDIEQFQDEFVTAHVPLSASSVDACKRLSGGMYASRPI